MSKALKKLIDINRLREFKNKLVGTGSAYVQTGAVDQTVAGTKTFSKPIAGSVTGSSGSCTGNAATATTAKACTGNAATATKLQTARTINGTSFNGTANITTANWGTARNISITDGTNTSTAVSVNGSANISLNLPSTIKATFVGNVTGNVTGNCSGSSGSCTGNAATATKLAAKRTIALSGAATGTATSFDGSGNITIPVTSLDASKLTGTASVSTTGNAATATTATTATNATYTNWLRTSSHSDHLFHTEWDNAGYFWTYVTAGDGGYRAVRVARSDSAANADHATSADSATRATSADRAAAANCVQSQTSDYHEIRFDWDSQVPGYVGLRVDKTDMGGIVTTNRLVSDIRAQWYAAYPDGAEAHNAMWGGRDITAAFNNGTVSANIANGTFRDIFPGDYITKQVTIGGIAYTVNWVIADCDYWINKGDAPITAHHVAIVPQQPLFLVRMNGSNTTEGGYEGSAVYKNTISSCAKGLVNAFGSDHILTFMDGITNSVDTSHVSSGIPQFMGTPGWWGEWVSVQCNLMSEKMVYGAPICSAGAMDNTMATRQMSAFRLSERLINYNMNAWWLRDVVSSADFAFVGSSGNADTYGASSARGFRPFALLK